MKNYLLSASAIGSLKDRWLVAALLALIPVLWASVVMATGPRPMLVRVGAYDNPPKITMRQDGAVMGFWPDLLTFIANQEGWQLEYVRGTWAEGLANLQSGAIDIMPDVAYTGARAKLYDFSDAPILSSWTRLYVRKGSHKIKRLTDLRGAKVAALAHSVNLDGPDGLRELIKGFNLQITVVELDDYYAVFRAVEEGKVAAGITNRNFGDKFASEYAVQATSIIFQPINMKFAISRQSKQSAYLLARINARIKELQADNNSIYYQLLSRYFETAIAEKHIIVLPHWVRLLLQMGGGLLLLLALVMGAAKIQINRQTKEIRAQNEALAAEKERLAVTINSIGDGVIATDNSGKISMINMVAQSLTGWSLDDALGRPLLDVFTIVNAQTGEECQDPVQKVLASGEIIGLANHTELVAKDGTRRSIADSGAPIFDTSRQIIGVILVFRDVTAKERNEAELLKMKKLESVGVLAGGIAHDFNNILAAILGNIELAAMTLDPASAPHSLLLAAKNASLRAKDLTQQLLTFAKGGDPVKQATSVAEIIVESANFVLRGSAVSCQFNIPADLWWVEIDSGQIGQVVQNLVLNGMHAMPEGGVLTITCDNITDISQELVGSGSRQKYIKISVEDHGSGIEQQYLDKIFDPYYTTKPEGNGLGLAITHSIVSKHDGYIVVNSEPGRGTTFAIYLPAFAAKPATQVSLASKDHKGSARILVMDDEEFIRKLAREMLGRLGYEVLLAKDGKEAVAQFREQERQGKSVDLVIMDLTIPGGMGGKEAVREILKIDPAASVVVASGYSNDPVIANPRQYGFKAALVKPFMLAELQALVNDILEGSGS